MNHEKSTLPLSPLRDHRLPQFQESQGHWGPADQVPQFCWDEGTHRPLSTPWPLRRQRQTFVSQRLKCHGLVSRRPGFKQEVLMFSGQVMHGPKGDSPFFLLYTVSCPDAA
jgi:hypothetical protein